MALPKKCMTKNSFNKNLLQKRDNIIHKHKAVFHFDACNLKTL